MYRRRKQTELMSEMAEVFEYTAELLAAGDSIREAIFNCYQNLCSSLQTRGLLRRDFETVRELEMAIRQAMPQISEESLLALDNMFEQAGLRTCAVFGDYQLGDFDEVNSQRMILIAEKK